MKRTTALLVALGVTFALAAPAVAITRGGQLDGNDHPYVGIMVADLPDGTPQYRCTGTLISPTVFVTAGHCSELPDVTVWFESDIDGAPGRAGYPFSGPTSVEGTAYPHPLYNPGAFFLYDLGVVVLDEPVYMDTYAQLPSAGYVDSNIGKGRKNGQVTAVGYGLQAATANPVKPEKEQSDVVRYQADLFVVDTNGVAGIGSLPDTNSMVLSGDAKHGGTCFGDSGGPTFHGDNVLVAVTSFGLNLNCGGIGGVFRIDRTQELNFIKSFLP